MIDAITKSTMFEVILDNLKQLLEFNNQCKSHFKEQKLLPILLKCPKM